MYRLDFFNKLLRILCDQAAVTNIMEHFIGKGIPGILPFLDILRQLSLHLAVDAVPNVHIGVLENLEIHGTADEAGILILPALPGSVRIQNSCP